MTVTPDCMHHVDTSISTSMVIGDNGVLTPALSPSVLSADAVDALYAINVSQIGDNTQLPNDINKDVPLNHRLPSPEEQCKIIALRWVATRGLHTFLFINYNFVFACATFLSLSLVVKHFVSFSTMPKKNLKWSVSICLLVLLNKNHLSNELFVLLRKCKLYTMILVELKEINCWICNCV